ncbi:helix-turn-helix domain-containing protein, partial [Streptomyces sp. NPDC051742]|uniref:helix-turn-helix domain-containing protein n=1 Tax=Streptomyces sp. NPDC051742 TaxID=3155169 RepID=UPI00341712A5
MPGWKALPDELDPNVAAFTERLRRLIDRSGLAVTAVAERTGHERPSWDAYLNGRLPVPRSAVVALAEVTGSDAAALATDWELAERAWSRGRVGDAEREGARDLARDGGRDAEPGRVRDAEPGRRPDEESGRRRDAEPDAGDRTMQIRRLDRPEPAVTSPGASPAPRPRTADSHPPAPTPTRPPPPPPGAPRPAGGGGGVGGRGGRGRR